MSKKCTECKKKIPNRFSKGMFYQGGYIGPCPDCARRLRNEMAGLPLDTPFHGEMANELWEQFQEWKEKKK